MNLCQSNNYTKAVWGGKNLETLLSQHTFALIPLIVSDLFSYFRLCTELEALKYVAPNLARCWGAVDCGMQNEYSDTDRWVQCLAEFSTQTGSLI